MTAERWALIASVFRGALERPVAERAAYLDQTCRGDELLRADVERLLAGEAEPSLPSPAVKLHQGGAAGLATGDTLAQYRVEGRIGEGGMGAVYEAHDTRLHRKVALKVLRPEDFGDPDRLARLMREARAASALGPKALRGLSSSPSSSFREIPWRGSSAARGCRSGTR